jgi:hypothetical protein
VDVHSPEATSRKELCHARSTVPVKAVLTVVHWKSLAVYVYKSVFKMGIFAFN